MADIGIVIIQAHTIFLATPHRTAENLFVEPTPMIDPDTTCVVLTGIPLKLAPKMTAADAVSAENP
jgi:hypothetical protein